MELDQTLAQLQDFLQAEFNLGDDELRLRDMGKGRLFLQEEMGTKLHGYEMFRAGAARIQIEKGRPCTIAEVNVRVTQLGNPNSQQFYFSKEITLRDAKREICQAFNDDDQNLLDADKMVLYRASEEN